MSASPLQTAEQASQLLLREAVPTDVPVMLRFIRELAEYEREPDAVIATEADLLRDGFGLAADGVTPLGVDAPLRFRAIVAEWDGVAAGFALYFTSYSTWLGRHGLRLEDLYVTPERRGRGIGRALLERLAAIAVREGCERLEWDVLAWNQPAIDVYHRVGAHVQTEWRIMRVAGDKLRALAAGVDRAQGSGPRVQKAEGTLAVGCANLREPGSEDPDPGHPTGDL